IALDVSLVFFFQAEDGIRDFHVTGVQTWLFRSEPDVRWSLTPDRVTGLTRLQDRLLEETGRALPSGGVMVYATCSLFREENEARSEERRVGKECRYRGSLGASDEESQVNNSRRE